MSKLDLCNKINDSLNKKINAYFDKDVNTFFEYDEYFELILCIAYTALTKEKIIKKDFSKAAMSNPSSLSRLNPMISDEEIDKVFSKDFSENIPEITSTSVNSNLWKLDKIRDSIMHGTFDVDMENKMIVINNAGFNFKALVPFKWFVDYTKNDIIKKKELDNYTFRGFYYNNQNEKKDAFNSLDVFSKSILYRVNISGNKFNVLDIKNDIQKMLYEESKKELSILDIAKYSSKYYNMHYSTEYLCSFNRARKIVRKEISKKYGVNVDITIEEKNKLLFKTFNNNISEKYYNYDLLFNEMNCFVDDNSERLVTYIQKMLLNLDKDFNKEKSVSSFVDLFDDMSFEKFNEHDNQNRYKKSSEQFLSILISLYGINNLVINYDHLLNDIDYDSKPKDFGLKVYSKRPIREYLNDEEVILAKLMNDEIERARNRDKYLESPSKKKLKVMTKGRMNESIDINKYRSILIDSPDPNFIKINGKRRADISRIIDLFNLASDSTQKLRIMQSILYTHELYAKEIDNSLYEVSGDMNEAITIIRNSFAHIGRINIKVNKGFDTVIIIKDFDNNGKKVAEVRTTIGNLVNLLSSIFNEYVDTKEKVYTLDKK